MITVNTLFGEEEVESRFCIHCNQHKPLHEMELDRPHHAPRGIGYRNECKKCRQKINSDRERMKKEYAYLRPHPTDLCIVCNKKGTDIHKAASQGYHKKKDCWVLDHCHENNTFRGWICNHCNNGLSGFKDSIETMERAIRYLKGELQN